MSTRRTIHENYDIFLNDCPHEQVGNEARMQWLNKIRQAAYDRLQAQVAAELQERPGATVQYDDLAPIMRSGCRDVMVGTFTATISWIDL